MAKKYTMPYQWWTYSVQCQILWKLRVIYQDKWPKRDITYTAFERGYYEGRKSVLVSQRKNKENT